VVANAWTAFLKIILTVGVFITLLLLISTLIEMGERVNDYVNTEPAQSIPPPSTAPPGGKDNLTDYMYYEWLPTTTVIITH